ncbi:hypothetical protein AVEN_226736-1 [Araneus ventricosus]|uniref:Uncharacterized protein n=1 Tax=Araneus ventricosus TaxID=182803 RepID=A0A4Y2UC51_ARAVE|nr:hypothetical protein AVEN_226736-1 [Araneus ventricosus]
MGSQRCWNLLDISISRGDTLECTRRFHVTSRPAAGGERLDDGVCIDRLGSPLSANVFGVRPQCELGSCSMTSIQKFTPERRVVVGSLHAGVKKGRNECAERLSTQKREFPLEKLVT